MEISRGHCFTHDLSCYVAVFPEIIKHVTTVDVRDDNAQTPLHVACMNGHITTVLKLIELKADIEAENVSGCTPLYFSCRHGHSGMFSRLYLPSTKEAEVDLKMMHQDS